METKKTMFFSLEDLSRDLAGLYAQGKLTLEEYLTQWESLLCDFVGDNGEKGVKV